MVKERGKGFRVVRSSEKHKLEIGSYARWLWENNNEENGFIFYGEKKLAPLYQYMIWQVVFIICLTTRRNCRRHYLVRF